MKGSIRVHQPAVLALLVCLLLAICAPAFGTGNAAEPLVLTAAAVATDISFYDPNFKVNYQITGGTPPYQLVYDINYEIEYVTDGNSTGEHEAAPPNTPAVQAIEIPNNFTACTLSLYARDAEGQTSAFYHYTLTLVDPLKMALTIGEVPQAPSPGGTILVNWSVTSGVPPFKATTSSLYVSTVTERTSGFFELPISQSPSEIQIPEDVSLLYDFILWVKVEDSEGRISGARTILKAQLKNDQPGDANADGAVDILDLVAIIDYIVSGTQSKSMDNADANGDGAVDILDLVAIIDQIVGG